jgi:putative aldouronate transport system substrate-binding protein
VFGGQQTAFFNQLSKQAIAAKQTLRSYYPFSADGTKPVYHFGKRSVGITSLKKGSPERLQEMLSILDWLAAPFGSQEDRLLQFGIEGTDFTLDDKGNPKLTERGLPDAGYVPWRYFASRPYVHYDPSLPDYAQNLQTDEKNEAPYGIEDPTSGFYSPAGATTGVPLNQKFADGISEIVKGSRPMSDYDVLVKEWVSSGGDKIRSEYQQALDSA